MKSLKELLDPDKTGWVLVKDWLENAKNQYEIMPKSLAHANTELLALQITTRSPMGAIVYETGGILIDYGWLRILGSGSKKLNRGLNEWNRGRTILHSDEQPPYLIIADDAIGGYFAINGGGLGTNLGEIYYFAPDILSWESLEIGYSDFLKWALNNQLHQFYQSLRWLQWKTDIKKLNGNQVFSFYPFLWTKEGKDIEKISRKIIPVEENYELIDNFYKQINQ